MDYSIYVFSLKEKIINIVVAIVTGVVVSYLFYGNVVFTVLFIPLLFPYLKIRKNTLKDKRKKELKLQFKDAITSMADALTVGYSVENAIKESYKEMKTVYGRESYICRELQDIIRKNEVNTSIEKGFIDLAKRSEVDEIILFAQVFEIAKRSGGNIVNVIQMIANSIVQSFKVEEEINVTISQKKLEQRIMYFVPIGIIVYVSVTSPGFLDVMYETILGRIVMTVCIVAYAVALYMAEKIMKIET